MKAISIRHSAPDSSGFQLRQAVLQDAADAGWKQSLNERPPAPESQDTSQIAATLDRSLTTGRVGTQRTSFPARPPPEISFALLLVDAVQIRVLPAASRCLSAKSLQPSDRGFAVTRSGGYPAPAP
jgi:hypothetical protein